MWYKMSIPENFQKCIFFLPLTPDDKLSAVPADPYPCSRLRSALPRVLSSNSSSSVTWALLNVLLKYPVLAG